MTALTHAPDDSFPGIELPDEAATLALGARLAAALSPGLKIWLEGDLGAGKTTLTRGLLRALGHTGPVKSPTYTLVEPYSVSGTNIYHFDFYRLLSPEEFLDAGLDEYFSGDGICLTEWPQKATPLLREPDIVISLKVILSGRMAVVIPLTEAGKSCLTQLTQTKQDGA